MDLENLVINVLSNEQYENADKQANQFYLTPEIIDNTPTENSQNTVTSGGVYTALSGKANTTIASASANGLMSSQDKIKLDGLPNVVNNIKYVDLTFEPSRSSWQDINNHSMIFSSTETLLEICEALRGGEKVIFRLDNTNNFIYNFTNYLAANTDIFLLEVTSFYYSLEEEFIDVTLEASYLTPATHLLDLTCSMTLDPVDSVSDNIYWSVKFSDENYYRTISGAILQEVKLYNPSYLLGDSDPILNIIEPQLKQFKEPIYQFEVWTDQACTKRPQVGLFYDTLYVQVNKAVAGNESFTFGNSNQANTCLGVNGYDTTENDGLGYISLYIDYYTDEASTYDGFPIGVYPVEVPYQAVGYLYIDFPLQYSFGEIIGYRETNNFYTKEETNSKLHTVGQLPIENNLHGVMGDQVDGYPILFKWTNQVGDEVNFTRYTDKIYWVPQYSELDINGNLSVFNEAYVGTLVVSNETMTSNAIIRSSINSLELQGEGMPVLKNINDDYTINFPNKSGTVALTSDIPIYIDSDGSTFINSFSENSIIELNNNDGSLLHNGEKVITEKDIEKIKPLILEGDEYYIKKNNNTILPLSHPDLSTQPSILPQRFGKYYLYEVLVPFNSGNPGDSIWSDIYMGSFLNKYLMVQEGNLILSNSTIIESSLFGDGFQCGTTMIKENDYDPYNDNVSFPLTFECLSSGTITLTSNSARIKAYHIHYTTRSQDILDEPTVINVEEGDTVAFYGSIVEQDVSSPLTFGGTAKVKVYGNIFSIALGSIENFQQSNYGENFNNTLIVFPELFNGYSNLIDASNLILLPKGNQTNSHMFEGMFVNCINMKKPPLKLYCWDSIIGSGAYINMFEGCTSIKESPYILAKTFSSYIGANYMFRGCTNLKYVKCNFEDFSKSSSTTTPLEDWLSNTSNAGIIAIPTTPIGNTENVPEGWNIVSYVDFSKLWKIYPNIPIEENLSKIKYLLVRYYNEYYPGYY